MEACASDQRERKKGHQTSIKTEGESQAEPLREGQQLMDTSSTMDCFSFQAVAKSQSAVACLPAAN